MVRKPRLSETHPGLCLEWHAERNAPLLPADVVPGSGRAIWWRCREGHEWRARVEQRTKMGTGCPYCGGQRATAEENLLALRPDIAAWWHPTRNVSLSPADLRTRSNKKVWWLCPEGHEWEAAPAQRADPRNKAVDCPACANRAVADSNSLARVAPEAAAQWAADLNGGRDASSVLAVTTRRVWWRCSAGHTWHASPRKRVLEGTGCPFCANQRVCSDNNLAVLNPALAADWHPTRNGDFTPERCTPGSNRHAWWRCTRGHEWEAAVATRSAGRSCPKCRPNLSKLELRILAEFRHLFGTAERGARLWGKEFDVFVPSARLCLEVDGYPWHLHRTRHDRAKSAACRDHGHVLVRVRDDRLSPVDGLAVTYRESDRGRDADLMRRLIALLLANISPGQDAEARMRDYLGREGLADEEGYLRLVSELPGPGAERSLAATDPVAAAHWHPTRNGTLTPSLVSAGSGEVVWWLCARGHEWQAASTASGAAPPARTRGRRRRTTLPPCIPTSRRSGTRLSTGALHRTRCPPGPASGFGGSAPGATNGSARWRSALRRAGDAPTAPTSSYPARSPGSNCGRRLGLTCKEVRAPRAASPKEEGMAASDTSSLRFTDALIAVPLRPRRPRTSRVEVGR